MGVTYLKNGITNGKRFQPAGFCDTLMTSDGNVYCKFKEIQQMASQKWQAPYKGLSKRAVEILRLLIEVILRARLVISNEFRKT